MSCNGIHNELYNTIRNPPPRHHNQGTERGARRQSSVGAALRSRPLYTFFRKKHGKGVDKTNLECYRKSIDVSTPLKRVLTKPEGKELEEWNWMREKGKY